MHAHTQTSMASGAAHMYVGPICMYGWTCAYECMYMWVYARRYTGLFCGCIRTWLYVGLFFRHIQIFVQTIFRGPMLVVLLICDFFGVQFFPAQIRVPRGGTVFSESDLCRWAKAHCRWMKLTAPHCDTLQRTATYQNTLDGALMIFRINAWISRAVSLVSLMTSFVDREPLYNVTTYISFLLDYFTWPTALLLYLTCCTTWLRHFS